MLYLSPYTDLPHPVDNDLSEIRSEFLLDGSQIFLIWQTFLLGSEHCLKDTFIEQQSWVLLSDASECRFAAQQIQNRRHGEI